MPKWSEHCVFHMFTSKRASRHNGVHFFDISTAKSGSRPFLSILASKCASRHNGPLFQHLNQDRQFLSILTSKCASRHKCIHILNISTSKSAPNPSFFYAFDIKMCFALHRRALFLTSQLPQVLREWCALYILTSKCASRHNGVQFWISSRQMAPHPPLERAYFSTLQSPKTLENTCFATFLPFRAPWSSFFCLSLLWSSFFVPSLLWLFPLLLRLYYTIPYYTIRYYIILYYTISHYTISDYIMFILSYVILYYILLYYTVLCYVVLSYVILYCIVVYVMLYCIVLCYLILYSAMLHCIVYILTLYKCVYTYIYIYVYIHA